MLVDSDCGLMHITFLEGGSRFPIKIVDMKLVIFVDYNRKSGGPGRRVTRNP